MDGDPAQNNQLDRHFDIEKILELPQGAVVFEHLAIDSLYALAKNSGNNHKLKEKVYKTEIIPVNADALGDYSSNHAVLQAQIITNTSLPSIPTIINLGGIRELRKYSPTVIPGIIVHKKSGLMYSHGGAGVSIIKSPQLEFTEQPLFELAQPFILPPRNSNGERFVMDNRVVFVGGKPVAAISRRASKPLTEGMISGEEVPTEDYFPTATHPGKLFKPEGHMKDNLYSAAAKVYEFLISKLNATPNRLFSEASPLGYASFDFLLDENKTPLLVDFDLLPVIRPAIRPEVLSNLSEYLISLAKLGGKQRAIIIVAEADPDFVQELMQTLQSSGYEGLIARQDLF